MKPVLPFLILTLAPVRASAVEIVNEMFDARDPETGPVIVVNYAASLGTAISLTITTVADSTLFGASSGGGDSLTLHLSNTKMVDLYGAPYSTSALQALGPGWVRRPAAGEPSVRYILEYDVVVAAWGLAEVDVALTTGPTCGSGCSSTSRLKSGTSAFTYAEIGDTATEDVSLLNLAAATDVQLKMATQLELTKATATPATKTQTWTLTITPS